MRRVRIAQIGTSRFSHGNLIFESLKKQSDIFEVVGYALPENEREKFPENMKAFDGCREMTVDEILNDPTIEAVAVETEEKYLTKYALSAVEHSKHVHMEKPGGTSLSDFERLIAAVKRGGKTFHIGYMYRYNPFIAELIGRAKSGQLGEIYSVDAQMSCIESKELLQWLEGYRGGMMFFLGCHLLDIVLQIQGTPKKVTVHNKATGYSGSAGEDIGMAVLEYEKGISFVKTSGVEWGGFSRRKLTVTGSKGSVELCPLEEYTEGFLIHTVKTEFTDQTSDWTHNGKSEYSDRFDRYDGMMSAFAEMVTGQKENPFTPDHELELYKLLLRCCGMA